MIVFPNAKINIGLKILRKRVDGYHDISTVMVPIDLCDILEIVKSEPGSGIRLFTSGNKVDCPYEKNLVYKAAKAMEEYMNSQLDINIYLKKIIPDGAGLGGGSSDAAFTIKCLNNLFEDSLDNNEMESIVANIGADCPFFIRNTPAVATGKGENLSPIKLHLDKWIVVIVKPPQSISTAQAYAGIVPHESNDTPDSMITRPVEEWRDCIVNDFEPVIYRHYPELANIKELLYQAGAIYASMSGSGSAFYALFPEFTDKLSPLLEIMKNKNYGVYVKTFIL